MTSDLRVGVKGITKRFGATTALSDVSLEIGPGEVRGLIGENGSGKSTLAAIVAGVLRPDQGAMTLDGELYAPADPVDAATHGVALIMQELGTVDGVSVQDNVFLGKEFRFSRWGLTRRGAMRQASATALAAVGAGHLEPQALVDDLDLEERKLIEIARALTDDPRVLIVDETSNALSQRGRDILYRVIAEHQGRGGSVLFITHDLQELVDICDSVTILRDGVQVDTLRGPAMQIPILKTLMVGREIADNYYRSDQIPTRQEEVLLTVEDASTDVLDHVSLTLHAGEILGVGGLADCGMHELGRALFALEPILDGGVRLAGGVSTRSPRHAISLGLGYMSKNRDTQALVLTASVRDNVCAPSLREIRGGTLLTRRKEDRFVDELAERLSIKRNRNAQPVNHLSGGNKQKVVLAKWLGKKSRVIIMDCPTRGIDIGVKEAIYQLMIDLKAAGNGIIMISEELPELIGMSDRILIMRSGAIVGEHQRGPDITEATLIHEML